MTSPTRAPVSSRTAISAALRARCGPGAVSTARISATAWSRVSPGVAGGSPAGRLGRAIPAAGLALRCPRLTSQAYHPDTAASLRAALAGDSPTTSSCRAYRATCSPVTPVTGCTPWAWHQASQDGARLARRPGMIPMSRA